MSIHLNATNVTEGLRACYVKMTDDIQDKKARDKEFGATALVAAMTLAVKYMERCARESPRCKDFGYIFASADMPDIDQDEFKRGFAQQSAEYDSCPYPMAITMDYRVHRPTGKGLLHIGVANRPWFLTASLAGMHEKMSDDEEVHRDLVEVLLREFNEKYGLPPPPAPKPKAKKGKGKKK